MIPAAHNYLRSTGSFEAAIMQAHHDEAHEAMADLLRERAEQQRAADPALKAKRLRRRQDAERAVVTYHLDQAADFHGRFGWASIKGYPEAEANNRSCIRAHEQLAADHERAADLAGLEAAEIEAAIINAAALRDVAQ